MDRIKIYSENRENFVVMPKVKNIIVGATQVANTVTMASGKVVKDTLGYRETITATWDYVPALDIVSLVSILRSCAFFYVEYPAPSGDASGVFEIEYPQMSIFCYKNNVALWHNVSLTMTAQELSI